MADMRKRFGPGNFMFEQCIGAEIKNVGGTAIRLQLNLATRSLPIIKHAFSDKMTRAAFMNGQFSGDPFEGAVELAELALLRGRTALAQRLDAAAARIAKHSSAVH
ncbi:hypothetical protein AB5I41_15035 [Sphingomonas sp. MMS24-JH45]